MRLPIAVVVLCSVYLTPGWDRIKAAPPCPPTAIVQGDASVTPAIRDNLSRQGVSLEGDGECPYVTARVEQHTDGLLVEIEDPDGRTSQRMVVGNGAAASIIGSWTRGDLNRSMLFPERPVSSSTVSDAELPPANVETGTVLRPVSAEPMGYIDLGGAVTGGFDGSVWFGGTAMGCIMLGPLCAGPGAGIYTDQGLSGDAATLNSRRLSVDLKATVDYPILFQSFSLRPGLQAGAVWMSTTRNYSFEEDGEHLQRSATRADWEMAVGGYLIGSIRLGRGLSLIVGASVTVLPWAQTSPFSKNESVQLSGDDDDDDEDEEDEDEDDNDDDEDEEDEDEDDNDNENGDNDDLEQIAVPFAGYPRGMVLGFIGLEYRF